MRTEQLNLFHKEPPEPIYEIGQPVFLVRFDTVQSGVVSRTWVCGSKEEPYNGYSIKLDKGGNDTIWDYLINVTAFTDEQKALKTASESIYKGITLSKDETSDLMAFHYTRKPDSYILRAVIAKAGENQLYHEDFMCYNFLETYPTTAERDKAYKSKLAKIEEEAEEKNAVETTDPILKPLYKVSDTLASHRDYLWHRVDERETIARLSTQ